MALIGKIRKNFWFVLILLGLALAAFILMDAQGSGPSGQVSSFTMGKVAGQKIDYQEFSRTEQAYYRNANIDVFQKRNAIWNFYVEKALIEGEANKLGLQVSDEELMDLTYGPNPSPIIQSNWRNPQTGQVDVATLQQFRTQFESGQAVNPELEAYWLEQQKQIIKDALQTKFTNLVNKGIYTPSWLAEETYGLENTKADFNFVKIPFDNIDGSGIELTDKDFINYMNLNKSLYEEKDETRNVEFAVLNVEPSEQDKSDLRGRLDLLKREFEQTTTDSLFAAANKGVYNNLFIEKDKLPIEAQDSISGLSIGQAYGPFEQTGNYIIVKMIDKRPIPDSVKARHILRTASTPEQFTEASNYIDSLKTVYDRRRASFEDLATDNTQDPGSKDKGGLYDFFPQGQMVPSFNDACFQGKVGGIYKVTTSYGVHLIKIEDHKFNTRDDKYRIASISQPIIPSQSTQDAAYDVASEIISSNKSWDAVKAAVEGNDQFTIETSNALKENDAAIGSLGSGQVSRDIIKWAFEGGTSLNDVSPQVYRFTDRVNYFDNKYVLASLKSINPPGMKKIDDVRDQIEVAVMNKKKGQNFVDGLTITSLTDLADQHSVSVQQASNATMANSFVQGVGNEPDVIGAAYSLDIQSVSQPIVGNSGVFVIQPLSRVDAGAPSNLPLIKQNAASAAKSQTAFKLIENMKERANIEDGRSKFY